MCQVSIAERLDAGQVASLRQKRLRRLLAHVLTRSRFYAEFYRSHGITLDKLPDVQLTDLPPIDKQIVMANFDELVCDPTITRAGIERFIGGSDYRAMYRGRCHVACTSGSTGSPAIFLYGRRDWDLMQGMVGTRVLRYRPGGRIRLAFILNTDGHHAGVKLCQGAPWIAFKQMALSINAPLDRMLRDVDRFQPRLLVGYGSGIALLAQQQLAGKIRIRPSRVICSGEPLTKEMAATIHDAFKTVPLDFYAASESLAIGVSCEHGRGIHLFDDWHCIEIVDSEGRPVQPGTPGRIRLTNLYNYTMPLIRYEINDEVTPAADPCPCGWPFRLVERVAGRTEQVLWFEKGGGQKECVHPFALAALRTPDVMQMQFIQTASNELLARIKTTADPATVIRQVKDRIATILRPKHLEPFITVRVEIVADIPNDPVTGKYRLVIPYRTGVDAPGLSQANAPCPPAARTDKNVPVQVDEVPAREPRHA
jgi:phenylacetate-coenzyme A ligase PaaK-like adenylate-forming protein